MSIDAPYERKQLVYELRQHLNKANRELRDAEDLARLNPGLWPERHGLADRVRSIHEQVTEDLMNGRTYTPPLLQRLAIAEDNLKLACDRLAELDALDDLLPRFR